MTHIGLWFTIVIAGMAALAIRLSFIVLANWIALPKRLQSGLRFVPAAVLLALAAPALLYSEGAYDISLGNERLLAGILAVLVAWRTGNVWMTIGVGMVSLWILQAIT